MNNNLEKSIEKLEMGQSLVFRAKKQEDGTISWSVLEDPEKVASVLIKYVDGVFSIEEIQKIKDVWKTALKGQVKESKTKVTDENITVVKI